MTHVEGVCKILTFVGRCWKRDPAMASAIGRCDVATRCSAVGCHQLRECHLVTFIHLQQAYHLETTRPSTKALKRRTASAAAKAGKHKNSMALSQAVYVIQPRISKLYAIPILCFFVHPPIFAKHPKTSARGRQLPTSVQSFCAPAWGQLNSVSRSNSVCW